MGKYDIRLLLVLSLFFHAGSFALFGLMQNIWGWYISVSYTHLISGVDDFAAWGVLFIYVCQLMALLKAVELGGNPDQPKGLDPYIKL